MLLRLNIKNFALIQELAVDFKEGFNILSGETGAGKSILIDAIDYVLGGKFSKDLIRTGEDGTTVEAIFSIENENTREILNELGIEFDDVLIICRETFISGRSLIKVNGKSLIVTQLKKIRERILDIHGQHQTGALLQKGNHSSYLDNYIFENIKDELSEFSLLREELILLRERINALNETKDGNRLLDYIKFQIEDIDKGKLKRNEEEDLKEEFSILSNAEKINNALKVSYGLLNEMDEGYSILDGISKIVGELTALERCYEGLKDKREGFEGAFYSLQELSRDIRDIKEEIVYDEERLAAINERLYTINSYKKKYGATIEDVLKHYDGLVKQYDDLMNREEILKKLYEEEEVLLNKMREVGKKLHNLRVDGKSELENKLLEELSYVGLNKSRLEISVIFTDYFNETGFDDVSILISTNPGEPLKQLERVLSGGELSRIMLAFKCVFADKDAIPTLIFDEIDTGISGSVGQRVGEKMYQVSINHQVLCITHLPQIAILSDEHYFVSKEVKDEKTFTKLQVLSKDEKIYQVATMLGGDTVSEATLENVKEMYNLSEIKKDEIKGVI
ncbi:MAG: DNA repair protein RecN [Clostridium sp.]